MAKRKSGLPILTNSRSGSSSSLIPSASSIANGESQAASGSIKLPRSRDTTSSSLSANIVRAGIQFGRPSSSSTSASPAGSQWSTLLAQTARGGISSALGGGGLKGLLGIGSIVSGFIGLFGGGKSSLPPLVRFEAPASQNQTVYVGSAGNPAKRADAGTGSGSSSGIYATSHAPNAQALQYQSAQIAQAVKQALLNSSSLNDVIAEI